MGIMLQWLVWPHMGNHRQGGEASSKDVAYHQAIEENQSEIRAIPLSFPVLG